MMHRHPRSAMVANALGFQCVWFSTVGGAAAGWVWLGPAVALVFAAATLALFGRSRADTGVLMLALPLGLLLDTAWVRLGLMHFVHPWPAADWAPVWIMALWLGFALTVNHSLAWLRAHWSLAVLFGALGGPLAYLGAERLFGAVAFPAPTWQVMLVLGIAWGAVLPALLALGRLLERPAPALAPRVG